MFIEIKIKILREYRKELGREILGMYKALNKPLDDNELFSYIEKLYLKRIKLYREGRAEINNIIREQNLEEINNKIKSVKLFFEKGIERMDESDFNIIKYKKNELLKFSDPIYGKYCKCLSMIKKMNKRTFILENVLNKATIKYEDLDINDYKSIEAYFDEAIDKFLKLRRENAK